MGFKGEKDKIPWHGCVLTIQVMAEKAGGEEEGSWVAQLRQYNSRHGGKEDSKSPLEGEDTEEDKRLLEEYYIKFKGESRNKYSLIPKFYSKVCIVCDINLT